MNPLDYALYGGEDYSLLFTVSQENKDKLCRIFSYQTRTPLFEIGEIVEGNEIEIVLNSDERKKITKTGYQHF